MKGRVETNERNDAFCATLKAYAFLRCGHSWETEQATALIVDGTIRYLSRQTRHEL